MLGEQAEKRLSLCREQRDKQIKVGRPGMKKAEKRREATVGQFGQVDGNSRKRRKFKMADEDWAWVEGDRIGPGPGLREIELGTSSGAVLSAGMQDPIDRQS